MIKKFLLWVIVLVLMGGAMGLMLQSPAFNNDGMIPIKYTCDGSDISPPLKWENPPDNTQSFVLIVEDPDAPGGTWDHWILFNIPAGVHELSENSKTLPPGTRIGMNSWKRNDYGGPCPPDRLHRYYFKLYALDITLPLNEGAEKSAIEKAMQNHILATAEWIGKYERKK